MLSKKERKSYKKLYEDQLLRLGTSFSFFLRRCAKISHVVTLAYRPWLLKCFYSDVIKDVKLCFQW